MPTDLIPCPLPEPRDDLPLVVRQFLALVADYARRRATREAAKVQAEKEMVGADAVR